MEGVGPHPTFTREGPHTPTQKEKEGKGLLNVRGPHFVFELQKSLIKTKLLTN